MFQCCQYFRDVRFCLFEKWLHRIIFLERWDTPINNIWISLIFTHLLWWKNTITTCYLLKCSVFSTNLSQRIFRQSIGIFRFIVYDCIIPNNNNMVITCLLAWNTNQHWKHHMLQHIKCTFHWCNLVKAKVPVRLPAEIPKFVRSYAKFPVENPATLLALKISQE